MQRGVIAKGALVDRRLMFSREQCAEQRRLIQARIGRRASCGGPRRKGGAVVFGARPSHAQDESQGKRNAAPLNQHLGNL